MKNLNQNFDDLKEDNSRLSNDSKINSDISSSSDEAIEKNNKKQNAIKCDPELQTIGSRYEKDIILIYDSQSKIVRLNKQRH